MADDRALIPRYADSLARAPTATYQSALSSASDLSAVLGQLRSLPANERADAQNALLQAAEGRASLINDLMVAVVDWVEEDPCWAGQNETDKGRLESDFPQVVSAARAGRKARDNRKGYLGKIEGKWGSVGGQVYEDIVQGSENRLRRLATLSENCKTIGEVKQRAGEALLSRLTRSGKGIRAAREYTAGDFDLAAEAGRKQASMMHHAAFATKARNQGFDVVDGWLHPSGKSRAKTIETEAGGVRKSIEGGALSPNAFDLDYAGGPEGSASRRRSISNDAFYRDSTPGLGGFRPSLPLRPSPLAPSAEAGTSRVLRPRPGAPPPATPARVSSTPAGTGPSSLGLLPSRATYDSPF